MIINEKETKEMKKIKAMKYFICILFGIGLLLNFSTEEIFAGSGSSAKDAFEIEFDKYYYVTFYNNNNFYTKMVMPSNGKINFYIQKQSSYFDFYIYDSAYNKVYESNGYAQCNLPDEYETYIVGLKKGTYYISFKPHFTIDQNEVIFSCKARFGTQYEIENNNSRLNANKLFSNMYRWGCIDYYFCNNGNETDYYYFDANEGEHYWLGIDGYNELRACEIKLINSRNESSTITEDKFIPIDDKTVELDFYAKYSGRYYICISRNFGEPIYYGLYLSKEGGESYAEGWNDIDGLQCWYENGERQGTEDDTKGVIGDGFIRGREIYDPVSDGWYWLDAVYAGSKAVDKEVWMPYIYQDEEYWGDEEIWQNARNSDSGMEQQVYNAITGVGDRGKWVRYDSQGKMIKGWYTVSSERDKQLYPSQIGNTYYYDNQTGLMAKGWITIDGINYHFDEVTGVLIQ